MQPDSPMRATLVVVGLFLAGVGLGSVTGRAAAARAQDPYAELDLFARVLTTIERDYVDELATHDLVDAAIRGMMGELDRQSVWLSSDQYQALVDDTEGAVVGVGIEVRPVGDAVEIVRVLPGSPALRGGLAPGDRVLAVDGHPVAQLGPRELEALLDGERGETAVLEVLRPGWDAPREIQTVRDRVHRPTVKGALLGPGRAYARIETFQTGAAAELALEVGRLADVGQQPVDGLILDLRDNPGGLLTEAVAVADLFLDEGAIVSTRRRTGEDEVHAATVGGFPSAMRVVVLVNGGSASASEIVAAALQETGRATIVGERTYGKGTVQQVYRHLPPNASALKLTVGRYYTPSGAPVATGEGRAPDHVVPYPRVAGPRESLRARLTSAVTDPAERDALLALVDQLPEEAPRMMGIAWDAPIADRLATDPQLKRAAELLD